MGWGPAIQLEWFLQVVDGFLGLNWFPLKPIPGQGLCYFQTGPETGLPGVVHSFTGYFSEHDSKLLPDCFTVKNVDRTRRMTPNLLLPKQLLVQDFD